MSEHFDNQSIVVLQESYSRTLVQVSARNERSELELKPQAKKPLLLLRSPPFCPPSNNKNKNVRELLLAPRFMLESTMELQYE